MMRPLPRAVPLSALLADIAEVAPDCDAVVRGLSLDSRAVQPGDVFAGLSGAHHHGAQFAAAAVARGAAAVVLEGPLDGIDLAVPVVAVPELRKQLGTLANRFYDTPSDGLTLIGVTGTNGKTSTVQLLSAALDRQGRRAGSIGTLGAGWVGELEPAARTTPDVLATHALIAAFADHGASHVAMEVSSHALDQGRVDGLQFRVAIFTNLTRDHLDYHGSMASYAAAKSRLFAWPSLQTAIVNLDDAFGRELWAALRTDLNRIGYSAQGNARAAWRADNVVAGGAGLSFDLFSPQGSRRIETALVGSFNVDILLAVGAALSALGFDLDSIGAALSAAQPVRGRMNRLGGDPSAPLVVVDYAHTPDALDQALQSLRAHTRGQLICVFGCGGDRDSGKRPQMAQIAEARADLVIVTDDNPRSEDGDAIVAAICSGFVRPDRVRIERDRARAIGHALALARVGDAVLIAGKGHETYQEVNGQQFQFDDFAVAGRLLESRP